MYSGPASRRRKKLSSFFRKTLAFSLGLGYNISRTFLSSSMAEHSAVNRRVVGSSPTWGANEKDRRTAVFFVALMRGLTNDPRLTPAAINWCGVERPQCGEERHEAWAKQGERKHSAPFDHALHPLAEPSAAGGRNSEAESGQNKDKTARRSILSYVLPPFRVIGSSPTWGANEKGAAKSLFRVS